MKNMKQVQPLMKKVIFSIAVVAVASSIDIILGALISFSFGIYFIYLLDYNFNALQDRIKALEPTPIPSEPKKNILQGLKEAADKS